MLSLHLQAKITHLSSCACKLSMDQYNYCILAAGLLIRQYKKYYFIWHGEAYLFFFVFLGGGLFILLHCYKNEDMNELIGAN